MEAAGKTDNMEAIEAGMDDFIARYHEVKAWIDRYIERDLGRGTS